MRALAAMLTGAAVAVLPASAALAASTPDLAVTVTADQPSYAENAAFSATVKVTNHGSAKALHAHIGGGVVETLENLDYGALETGFDLDAGATRTFTVTGTTTHLSWRYGFGTIVFTLVSGNGDANDADNNGGVSIFVPGAFGDLTVRVCGGNVSDGCGAGFPGVPGIRVSVTDQSGGLRYTRGSTDANGVVHLTHIPAGSPLVRFTAPPGWKMVSTGAPDAAQIVEGQPAELSAYAYAVPTGPYTPAPPARH